MYTLKVVVLEESKEQPKQAKRVFYDHLRTEYYECYNITCKPVILKEGQSFDDSLKEETKGFDTTHISCFDEKCNDYNIFKYFDGKSEFRHLVVAKSSDVYILNENGQTVDSIKIR